MPRVSVIVPAYNYGRYLREAVDSIWAQDFDDLEVLIVDNGSTDDTPEVIASIRDPRVQAITLTPNQGLSVAVNTALERARGEYVAYLDADDRWRPGKLRRQLEVMDSEPEVGVVFSDFVRFNEERVFPQTQFTFFPQLARIPTVPTRSGGGRRITVDAFSAFVEFADPPAWLQTMLFRRSAIEGLRFVPGMRLCQDTEFCLRLYLRTGVAYVEEPLAEVRRHGENLTRDIPEMTHAKVAAFRMLEAEPLTPEQRSVLTRRIGRAWIDSGHAALRQKHPLRAAKCFGRALAYTGARKRALKNLAALPLRPLLVLGGPPG